MAAGREREAAVQLTVSELASDRVVAPEQLVTARPAEMRAAPAVDRAHLVNMPAGTSGTGANTQDLKPQVGPDALAHVVVARRLRMVPSADCRLERWGGRERSLPWSR